MSDKESGLREVGMLLLEAVATLHARGCERVRVLPGMSASGMHWRVSVTVAENLRDGRHPGVTDMERAFHYTTGSGFRVGKTEVGESTRVEDVADLLFEALGDGLEGPDPEYARWYADLMRLVRERGNLPIAYADYFDVGQGWEVGWGSGVRVAHPPRYVPVQDDEPVTESREEQVVRVLPARIVYQQLNSKQQEIYNFQKVAALLADYGFNCIKLADDWHGADFLADNVDGTTLKVQLKSVLTIQKKYLGKSLHMTFPIDGTWYLVEHDRLVEICGTLTPWLQSAQWASGKPYWSNSPSAALRAALAPFVVGDQT